MGDLIFLLPVFIIFFAILFKIILFLKKIFNFFKKTFNLTIDEADANEIDNQVESDNDNYLENYQKHLDLKEEKAKTQSIAEKKKELSRQKQNSEINSKMKKNKEIKNNREAQKEDKVDSLADIFSDYSEAEKAVLYNEILSKPKSLQND